MPIDAAELLYRERFSLSWSQMQEEPADVINYWMHFEEERLREEKRLADQR